MLATRTFKLISKTKCIRYYKLKNDRAYYQLLFSWYYAQWVDQI